MGPRISNNPHVGLRLTSRQPRAKLDECGIRPSNRNAYHSVVAMFCLATEKLAVYVSEGFRWFAGGHTLMKRVRD